jgi:hypothetical protein
MDALVAPLEPGEYGKMPIEYRHSNSQRTAPAVDEVSETSPPALSTSTSSRIPDNDNNITTTSRPIRRPIFQRDKFDGVDSDDESSEEDEGFGLTTNQIENDNLEEEEDEEDQPQIVGEVEIDMAQEEEDFLRFSREALGIDDATWASIIADREKRGGKYCLFT